MLKIRTTKEFGESTVSKILDLVENASSKKSRSENFISKFAKIYTPAVCYGALALAIIPPLVSMIFLGVSPQWGMWIYRALTFLVISCPCALGLATPVAIMVGNGVGAKNGIMFKTAISLEQTGKIQIAALDKTGTITAGEPVVTDVIPDSGISTHKLVSIAKMLEARSEHPLAKAIVNYDMKQMENDNNTVDYDSILTITESKAVAGNGLSGQAVCNADIPLSLIHI